MESGSSHPIGILLVDDREENLLALEAVLGSPEYRLFRAMSGPEALAQLAGDGDCAVVLLDVQMPGMDGYETARRIRLLPKHRETPIIFLTALYRDDQYVRAGYEVGAVDFLMKPLDVPALRSKVSVFVDLYRKTQKLIRQEKQLMQATLRITEERLRSVVSHASIMLWSTDLSGTITVCEGQGFRDWVHGPEDLLGKNVFEVFSEAPRVVSSVNRALRGESFVSESEHEGVWWETRYSPLVDGAGEGEGRGVGQGEGRVVGMIAVSTDITLRKKAEVELQQALQIRDEFLSIASHELKTPLTPLRLGLQLLRRKANRAQESGGTGLPSEDIIPKLDMAEAQIVRLAKLVDDLLDVSRMSNHRLLIEREDMDIAGTIREIAARFAAQADAVGSPITVVGPETLIGRWDRMRMEQVLTNLVSNAIKYGDKRPVDIAYQMDGGMVRITVADRGIGIAPKDLDRVFARFERAVSENEFGGLGLGLYIVRQLVEAHQGRIWVESELGRGSRFIFIIPPLPAGAGLGLPTSGLVGGLVRAELPHAPSVAIDPLRGRLP